MILELNELLQNENEEEIKRELEELYNTPTIAACTCSCNCQNDKVFSTCGASKGSNC